MKPDTQRWLRRLITPSIRAQLTLWYTAMFAVVLALAAVLALGAVKTTLDWRVDATLHDQALRIAAGVGERQGTVIT